MGRLLRQHRWKSGVVLVGVLMACALLIESTSSAKQPRPPAPWIYGNHDARFTLTEYADLECPYCKNYFPELKAWVDAHPDVNLQWHHLPLSMHEPAASREAQLAECAGRERGNGGFWRVVELIYQQTRSDGAGLATALQVPDAELELSQAVQGCTARRSEQPQLDKEILHQAAQAAADGVHATPTIILTDSRSGHSLKLQGAADGNVLLSAVDWLAAH